MTALAPKPFDPRFSHHDHSGRAITRLALAILPISFGLIVILAAPVRSQSMSAIAGFNGDVNETGAPVFAEYSWPDGSRSSSSSVLSGSGATVRAEAYSSSYPKTAEARTWAKITDSRLFSSNGTVQVTIALQTNIVPDAPGTGAYAVFDGGLFDRTHSVGWCNGDIYCDFSNKDDPKTYTFTFSGSRIDYEWETHALALHNHGGSASVASVLASSSLEFAVLTPGVVMKRLPQITRADVLTGSLTGGYSGRQVHATFSPGFGLSLSEAASILGFDHFNWYNDVVEDPHAAEPYLEHGVLQPGFSNVVPYFDPPQFRTDGSHNILPDDANGDLIDDDGIIEPADDLPWYWNEKGPVGKYHLANPQNSDLNHLYFFDSPTDPRLQNPEKLAFITFLVGVRANGTREELAWFDWTSNSTGQIGQDGGGETANVLPVVGGTGGIIGLNLDVDLHDLPISVLSQLAADGISIFLPGDYDRNGTVDALDYDVWRASFGSSSAAGAGADGNGDRIVDATDYVVWRKHLGLSLGSGSLAESSVPEPVSWLLALIALTCVMSLRESRQSAIDNGSTR